MSKIKTHLDSLALISRQYIAVGIPSEHNGTHPDGVKLAELGAIHEYGSPKNNIPARPWLSQAVAKNKGKWVKQALTKLKDTNPHAMEEVALMAQGDVQLEIAQGDFAELKQSTINRKGSSKPLIDTGYLRQSIKGVVRDGND